MSVSKTMSIPGAPKVVIAEFECLEVSWKIPFGLDLQDKSVVKEWWVRWTTLHIEYTDGRSELLDADWENEPDLRRPVDERIDDADDIGLDFDEEIEKYLANLEEKKPQVFFDIQIKRLKRNPLVNLGFFMKLDIMRCGLILEKL